MRSAASRRLRERGTQPGERHGDREQRPRERAGVTANRESCLIRVVESVCECAVAMLRAQLPTLNRSALNAGFTL